MTSIENTGLSAPRSAGIMRAAVMLALFAVLALLAERVAAQQPQQQPDDLDVTMQIIVDPDAKRPDEVVRRIPLPTRKPADSQPTGQTGPSGKQESGKPEDAGGGKEARDEAGEAREHGREASEAAKERAREAAEQREAARRAEAEERRRERGPPDDRPDPPNRPPRN
jgi:hypothetical protein